MFQFDNTLRRNGLIDLGYVGQPYTWKRGDIDKGGIMERLDRACATSSWINMHPQHKVWYLPFLNSDHCPILVESYEDIVEFRGSRGVSLKAGGLRIMILSLWLGRYGKSMWLILDGVCRGTP